MKQPLEENRAKWNELVAHHFESEFYNVAGFIRTDEPALDELEQGYLGDIQGKDCLHLQCHFGLSTLSMLRLGARSATGVDFAPAAIEKARKLAGQTGLSAKFVCADVLDLPSELHSRFDVVFASYGVLCWLPDLLAWARNAAMCLREGGTLVLVEIHPVAHILYGETPEKLRHCYDAFKEDGHIREECDGSYAVGDVRLRNRAFNEWAFTFSELFNAFRAASVYLERFEEYPFCCYRHFPFLEETSSGHYAMPKGHPSLPLSFGMLARKNT